MTPPLLREGYSSSVTPSSLRACGERSRSSRSTLTGPSIARTPRSHRLTVPSPATPRRAANSVWVRPRDSRASLSSAGVTGEIGGDRRRPHAAVPRDHDIAFADLEFVRCGHCPSPVRPWRSAAAALGQRPPSEGWWWNPSAFSVAAYQPLGPRNALSGRTARTHSARPCAQASRQSASASDAHAAPSRPAQYATSNREREPPNSSVYCRIVVIALSPVRPRPSAPVTHRLGHWPSDSNGYPSNFVAFSPSKANR